MLPSIPQSLLVDIATIEVCTGIDMWGNSTNPQTYVVNNVHLQNTNEVKKTKDNTEVVLRSILFIDSKKSNPQLDYAELVEQSELAGKPLRCVVTDSNGNQYGDFEVLTVDLVPGVPATKIHHVELGLV